MQHVQQKTQKEVEKRQQKVVEQEKKKEASLKLKKVREEAVKRKLEYKGLHRPSQALASSSHHDSKTLSPGPSLPSDKRGKTKTSKSSPSSSKSSAGSSSTSGEQSSSSRSTKHKPASSKSGDKAATPHASRTTSSQKSLAAPAKPATVSKASVSKSKTMGNPPVVKFDELMKMAKMNRSSGEEKLQGTAVVNNGKGDDPPRQISSPIGKSLLERTSSRMKGKRGHDEMMSNASKSLSKSNCIDLTGASSSIKAHSSTGVFSATKSITTIDRHTATSNLSSVKASPSKPRLQQNGRNVSSEPQCTTVGGGSSRHTLFKSPSKAPQKQVSRSQPVNKMPRPKPKPKSVQATAFYGSAAARILKQKDRSSGGAPFRYSSSWVDEMKDLVAEEYEGYSEEDDDDMDGFVVGSDDDFIDDGEAGDYSSHIREIFGYDKRK